MKGLYLSEFKKFIPSVNNLSNIHISLMELKNKVGKIIRDAIPNRPIFLQEVKTEVWKEFSLIYYKYEDIHQKRAFRMVISEISECLNDGNWGSVYNKLYRFEQLSRNRPSMPSIDF
jgi:hypothetical protein